MCVDDIINDEQFNYRTVSCCVRNLYTEDKKRINNVKEKNSKFILVFVFGGKLNITKKNKKRI